MKASCTPSHGEKSIEKIAILSLLLFVRHLSMDVRLEVVFPHCLAMHRNPMISALEVRSKLLCSSSQHLSRIAIGINCAVDPSIMVQVVYPSLAVNLRVFVPIWRVSNSSWLEY